MDKKGLLFPEKGITMWSIKIEHHPVKHSGTCGRLDAKGTLENLIQLSAEGARSAKRAESLRQKDRAEQ